MRKLLILIGLGLALLPACGGGTSGPISPAGGPTGKLDLKIAGKDSTLNEKSGTVNLSEMNFTAPDQTAMKTSLHTIYIANFEIDSKEPGWMRKPLAAPDQMRVDIELTGESGTSKDTPPKVGTYGAQADKTSGVRSARIVTFADGKQTETRFSNLMGYGSKNAAGQVRITSVTAEQVSGEIDLTEGDKSIKGTFTANLPAAKK